jgi:hypothetical protein
MANIIKLNGLFPPATSSTATEDEKAQGTFLSFTVLVFACCEKCGAV